MKHTGRKMQTALPLMAVLLPVLLLAGCAMLQGQYYLNSRQYDEGARIFGKKLAESPDDPQANYYMARFELASEHPAKALPFIKKAVALDPKNADYRFWEGVTWWALMEPDKERAAYEQALAIDPRHEGANLYLGHNYLDRGDNAEALEYYDKVLDFDPHEPQAMFNKAVALERLHRTREMRAELLVYLELYPDGAQARQGAEMLNEAGDFSWRNHAVGRRTVTLQAIDFSPAKAILTEDAQESLDVIGSIMSDKKDLELDVVAYVKGDPALARERALSVRNYITRMYPGISPDRLALSWFGAAETVHVNGARHDLPQSVNLFTRVAK